MHLKAGAVQESEDVRADTMRQLLSEIQKICGTRVRYVVLLGDFNANPRSTAKVEAKCVPEVQALRHPTLHSAYPWNEGAWTTWKIRKGQTIQHVIDYIFYSDRSTPPSSPRCIIRRTISRWLQSCSSKVSPHGRTHSHPYGMNHVLESLLDARTSTSRTSLSTTRSLMTWTLSIKVVRSCASKR